MKLDGSIQIAQLIYLLKLTQLIYKLNLIDFKGKFYLVAGFRLFSFLLKLETEIDQSHTNGLLNGFRCAYIHCSY